LDLEPKRIEESMDLVPDADRLRFFLSSSLLLLCASDGDGAGEDDGASDDDADAGAGEGGETSAGRAGEELRVNSAVVCLGVSSVLAGMGAVSAPSLALAFAASALRMSRVLMLVTRGLVLCALLTGGDEGSAGEETTTAGAGVEEAVPLLGLLRKGDVEALRESTEGERLPDSDDDDAPNGDELAPCCAFVPTAGEEGLEMATVPLFESEEGRLEVLPGDDVVKEGLEGIVTMETLGRRL